MISDLTILHERLILELVIGSMPYFILALLIVTRVCQILHLPLNYNNDIPISLRFKIMMTFFLSILLVFITISTYLFEDYWMNEADKRFSLIYVFHSVVLIMQILLMCYEFKKQIPTPWYINLLFWALISLLYFIFLMNSILFLVFFSHFHISSLLLIYKIYFIIFFP